MKKQIIAVLLLTLPSTLHAAYLYENFSNGIPENQWDIIGTNTSIPWSVTTQNGLLRISKPADPDGLNVGTSAGIVSNFKLSGNFEVCLDYSLLTWPRPSLGYNLARVHLYDQSGNWVLIGRHNLGSSMECMHFRSSVSGNTLVGTHDGNYSTGIYTIKREGTTFSAWANTGSGNVSLGSINIPSFNGPVTIELKGEQGIRPTGYRSFSELDVAYDNVSITADIIIPEPCTLLLLGLGGIFLRNRI